MQLTIDVKDSALDKILYFLENLKSDVTILSKQDSNSINTQLKHEVNKAISEVENSDFISIDEAFELAMSSYL